jgi:hypothetical protein
MDPVGGGGVVMEVTLNGAEVETLRLILSRHGDVLDDPEQQVLMKITKNVNAAESDRSAAAAIGSAADNAVGTMSVKETLLEGFRKLGVTRRSPAGRALLGAVERGLITELKCAMPVCERGEDRREDFDPSPPPLPDWMWSAEHVTHKRHGGKLTPENVQLAHRRCNSEDFARTVRKRARKA